MAKIKKLLAVLICMAITLAFVPAMTVGAAEIVNSGICGDDLIWTFDDAGTLTISGTGEMENYVLYAPWSSVKRSIENIVIEDGVTSIGSHAFYDCDSISSISLPDSVTSIGSYAFSNCNFLSSISLPDSVTSIGRYAFSDCNSLSSISLPDSVTSIGEDAFYDCDSLSSISLPDSVTSIGDRAFYGCDSLSSISLPDSVTSIGECAIENTAYYQDNSNWIDGLFLYVGNHLIEVKSTKLIGSDDIRIGTVTIAGGAFSGCSTIRSINIPSSVKRIGDKAFYNCQNLKSVTIPVGVTSIGDYAFWWCTSLADIYYGGSEEDWDDISIGSSVWGLTDVTIHYNFAMPTTTDEQSDAITVTLNGSAIEFDQPPVIIDGRTLVPLRAIFEALGADVEWDGDIQTVTAIKDGTAVEMTIGQAEMSVNGEAKSLDTPPQLINSRTLVPARAVAEAFGCSVDWNNETRTVIISM